MSKIDTMDEKACLAEIEKNEAKREDLFKQKEPIDRSLTRLYNRNQKLADRIAKIKAGRKTIDWGWLLFEDDRGGMEKHNLRELKLRELGLGTSGYYPEIQQTKLQISLVKNDPESLRQQLKGLKKLLKYLKPAADGYKVVDIFERTLSRYGVYDLLINEEKEEYLIRVTQYHHPEILHRFKTLKDALELIQNDYYYEDASEESDY